MFSKKKKMHLMNYSPQNYAFHNRQFKVLLRSMSMQLNSDEMHSDTIAIR